MVRKHLPPVDRVEAITWPLVLWSDGDGKPVSIDEITTYLQHVGAYMNRINPSQVERAACVMTAAMAQEGVGHGGPDRPTLDEWIELLRKWVASHAPEPGEPSEVVTIPPCPNVLSSSEPPGKYAAKAIWGHAREVLEMSLSIKPCPQTHYALAQVYEALGEKARAAEHYALGLRMSVLV